MELINKIKNLNIYKVLEQSYFENNLNQCLFLEFEDEVVLDEFICAFAQLVIGDLEKIKAKSHPDIIYFPKNGNKNLIVQDVSEIIEKSVVKPAMANKKIFVIKAGEQISLDCQNKLLKVLEDTPKELIFIICAKTQSIFLPTVLSRLTKIYLEKLALQDFRDLGFSEEDYYISGGSLEKLKSINENAGFKKMLLDIKNMLENLNSSADVVYYSRQALDKKNISEIIKILFLIFSDVLKAKMQNEKCYYQAISQDYSANSCACIFSALEKANKQLKANCMPQAILDCLLIKIVEEKVKWKNKN